MQRQGFDSRIVLDEVAHALGHRQHPLAHRQTRYDVIGKMGGSLDHAPGVAGRTYAAALAREGDEEVVAALAAMRTGKTVSEDAAFQGAAEFPLDMSGWRSAVVSLTRQREPRLEVRLNGSIE